MEVRWGRWNGGVAVTCVEVARVEPVFVVGW
jgi:hypothetical protein